MKYGDPKLNNQITIADIGTGSGCLAITAKLELPQAKVIASDSSKNALKVASTNAQNHKVDIDFFHGSLLDALPPSILHLPYSILLANLPYVPDNFAINLDARHEPRSALFGGVDGLDLYRQLFQQTRQLAIRPVYILSESLPEQHKKMTQIAKANQYSLLKSDGFVQLFG